MVDRLTINTPLNKPTVINLLAAYFITIDRNLNGLHEGRFVYYEQISITTKHICRINVPSLLRHTTINLIHATPIARYMGEYKTLYRILF